MEKRRVIIADISSVKIGKSNFGHYRKVSGMYQKMLKGMFEVCVAGGPIYMDQISETAGIRLPFDVELDNLRSAWGRMVFKIRSIINGRRLFKAAEDAVVICQPYSFLSWMISILFAKKSTRIYLIEYRDELDKKVNRILFSIAKKKIAGVLCPNQEVGDRYGIPYLVVPDYIDCEEHCNKTKEDFLYDFGMVGIMSEGKDIEDVIRTFSNTRYRVLIAGYFGNQDSFQRYVQQKTENIVLVNRYLSETEYRDFFEQVRYVILPYKESYRNASSGVIFDVLFHQKPVITKNFPNFQFVNNYHIGILYHKTLKELDIERLLSQEFYRGMQSRIGNYLKDNKKSIQRIAEFLS